MRPQAVALTDPADPEASELIRLRATCRRQEFAIEGLTQALGRLRRGASALKDENAELRVELDRIRQRAVNDAP
jgi:regulator of replication initiation timing